MKKHLLFVGDLRPAKNYGAIATTEALLDLVHKFDDEYEIQIIDRRSFSGKTPKGGYKQYSLAEKGPQTLKGKLKKIGILKTAKKWLDKSKNESINPNVPNRLDDYKAFTEKIKSGNLWAFEKKMLEWADIVVINSEGNIVNGTDANGIYREGGRYVLFFAYLTKFVFEKPCHIINHTVDPRNRDIIKLIKYIYPHLDSVYVREKLSIKLLESHGVMNAKYVPDALWSHDFEHDSKVGVAEILKDFDFTKPYICIGDSSGVKNKYGTVKWDVEKTYARLIAEFRSRTDYNIVFIDGFRGNHPDIVKATKKAGITRVCLDTCDYHQLYYLLKHAAVFVSGRWHASIISLMSGTPVVLYGSDSHKTEALYSEIEYPFEFFDIAALPLNIDRIVSTAISAIKEQPEKTWELVGEKKILAQNNVDFLAEQKK